MTITLPTLCNKEERETKKPKQRKAKQNIIEFVDHVGE